MKTKIVEKAYYIPYSKRAVNALERAKNKLGITWSIDENEIITIKVKERYLPRLEKILAAII